MTNGKMTIAVAAIAGLVCTSTACEPPHGANDEVEVGTSALGITTLGYQPPSCSAPGSSFSCGFREGPIAPELAAACTDERWIGYQLTPSPQRCERARRTARGTWTFSKPFTALPQPNMPNELQRFCVYEWQPARWYSGAPVISALPNTASMRLERDCKAVVPLLTPGASRAIFEEAQATQMNLPDFPPAAVFPSPTRTRVAIVDTSPTETNSGLPSPGADGHGLVVGAIARNVSCMRSGGAEVGCAADIMSYQGLPLGDDVASYGQPFDVGLAMGRALAEWMNAGTNDNIIINLSVGWDAKYTGVHGPHIRMTGLSPYLVAQWAACEGALVVASAGNRSQVGGASGPMFPGGWEQDTRLCAGPPNLYSPLVHAAGAIDGKDETLRVARPGGNPRLLAPSAFSTASAPKPSGGQSRGKLVSGTSVSAANLSGLAALVWALEPGLSSDEVMDEIYRGAVFFGEAPDFANPQGLWTQARIDACAAAARVCQPGFNNCPVGCVPRAVGDDAQADYETAFDLEYPGLRAGPVTPGATITKFSSVPLADEATVEPHAGPQPGGTICPLCGFDAQFIMGQLELTPDMTITDVFVRPDQCDPEWCDPELGGVFISLPDPKDPFKVDVSKYIDVVSINSALLEVTTETDGQEIVRSSELFINP